MSLKVVGGYTCFWIGRLNIIKIKFNSIVNVIRISKLLYQFIFFLIKISVGNWGGNMDKQWYSICYPPPTSKHLAFLVVVAGR
jgi:hypothetical protein